jgi:hypothetical protein
MLSGPDLNEMTDEYKIITGDKNIVIGKITDAKEFEEEVEKSNGDIQMANGYSYTYIFQTIDNQEIQAHGWNYGELPLEKALTEVPYQIEVEYLTADPNLNRVYGLWSNNSSLWEWFKHKVLLKLIGLIFCLYISYVIIKEGIETFKIES